MSSYTPCAGTGKLAVSIDRYPSQPNGLGMTQASTYGNCPSCGRLQRVKGLVQSIEVTRHKPRTAE